jgi:ParB/RepB/Spo0J family partition protein
MITAAENSQRVAEEDQGVNPSETWTVAHIPLENIETNPFNPREDLDEAELQTLAASFSEIELLHPVHVQPLEGPGRFRLIAGERRLEAARIAGWRTIPAKVCAVDQATAAKMMVAENMKRKQLNPMEEARSIALLKKPASKGGAGMSYAEIATFFGKSLSWISNALRMLSLPKQWQDRVASGEVPRQAALAVLSYRKRPDVLAAIEEDYRTNPDEWRLATDFWQNAKEVADRLDSLMMSEVPTDCAEQERDAPTAEPAPQRAASVEHYCQLADSAGCPEDAALKQVLECIAGLTRMADLDRIEKALTAKRQELMGQESRRPIEDLLREYERDLRAADRTDSYIRERIGFIRKLAEDSKVKSVADITRDVWACYAAKLRDEGQTAETIKVRLYTLKGFVTWLVKHDKLADDPLRRVTKQDAPRRAEE